MQSIHWDRFWLATAVGAAIALATLGFAATCSADAPELLIVVGAEGEASFGKQFHQWADAWQKAAEEAKTRSTVIGVDEPSEPADRQQLEQFLRTASESTDDANPPLWIVLLGHGTYDGRMARFNLRGPDVSAEELSSWLAAIKRPLVVIDTTACSAPFLATLSAADRVVVTATQSGDEQQFTRLGGALAEAVTNQAADLDKDQQTSLLEAVVYASRQVARFYTEQGRLATEHALVDDNGDKMGTPVAWFEGVMATAKAKTDHQLDGGLAHQWHLIGSPAEDHLGPEGIARRTDLEHQLYDLRRTRAEVVDEEGYYARLEPILVEIARLYEQAEEQAQAEHPASPEPNAGESGPGT